MVISCFFVLLLLDGCCWNKTDKRNSSCKCKDFIFLYQFKNNLFYLQKNHRKLKLFMFSTLIGMFLTPFFLTRVSSYFWINVICIPLILLFKTYSLVCIASLYKRFKSSGGYESLEGNS